jgi:hypothetical protein
MSDYITILFMNIFAVYFVLKYRNKNKFRFCYGIIIFLATIILFLAKVSKVENDIYFIIPGTIVIVLFVVFTGIYCYYSFLEFRKKF